MPNGGFFAFDINWITFDKVFNPGIMPSLKSVKAQLITAKNLLQYSVQNVSNQPTLRQLTNSSNIKRALDILMSLGIFKSNTDPLKGSEIFSNNATHLVTHTDTIGAYVSHLNVIISQLTELINAFNIFEPTEDPNSINITLPDTINDFTKLAKVANEINLAISQPLVISDFNSEATIKGVENGTITINVGFNIQEAGEAVLFVISMIGVALRYRKLKLEGDELVEKIREKKKKNDKIAIEGLEEVNKADLKEMIDEEAKLLLDKYYINKAEEHQQLLGNLVHSIDTLSTLFSEGVIITPSINANPETRKQFPSVSEIQLLENKIKQLKSGEGREN